jgi:excisionase family DNA binding protein
MSRYNQSHMATTTVEFTFDEAVRTMGVTPTRLEKLIAEGKIPAARRDGVHITIPREAILEYLAQVSAVPLKQRTK